jgi:hypothetical protein
MHNMSCRRRAAATGVDAAAYMLVHEDPRRDGELGRGGNGAAIFGGESIGDIEGSNCER